MSFSSNSINYYIMKLFNHVNKKIICLLDFLSPWYLIVSQWGIRLKVSLLLVSYVMFKDTDTRPKRTELCCILWPTGCSRPRWWRIPNIIQTTFLRYTLRHYDMTQASSEPQTVSRRVRIHPELCCCPEKIPSNEMHCWRDPICFQFSSSYSCGWRIL